MAKRAKVAVIDELPHEEEDELTAEQSDVLGALAEMEGASDAKWKVHRIAPLVDGKMQGYCDTLTSSELTMEELRNRFGRGTYRVVGHDSKSRYLSSATLKIASDPPRSDAPAASTPNNGGDILAILTQRDATAKAERRELMLALGPPLLAAIPAIFSAMRPTQTDPLLMIGALKQLQPDPPKAPDMMPLVTALIEAARDGGKGGETNWMDLVKGAVEQLPGLVSQLRSAPPAQPQPQRVHVTSAPNASAPQIQATPASAATTGEEDVNALKLLQLSNWAKGTLQMLVSKAAKSADPGLYADFVLDNVPEGVDVREFIKYLAQENWWEIVQQFEPATAPYRGWFTQFRDFLADAVEEQFGPLQGGVEEENAAPLNTDDSEPDGV